MPEILSTRPRAREGAASTASFFEAPPQTCDGAILDSFGRSADGPQTFLSVAFVMESVADDGTVDQVANCQGEEDEVALYCPVRATASSPALWLNRTLEQ